MSEKKHPAPDPRRGPFDLEINTRAIVTFGVWLVIGVVIVLGLMLWLQSHFETQARRQDMPPSPVADHTGRRLPPEPRLQVTPELDLRAYRAEEERRVASWGWVDEKAGIAHIPVERAMEIVASRGLPSRPARPPVLPGPDAAPSPAPPSGGRP